MFNSQMFLCSIKKSNRILFFVSICQNLESVSPMFCFFVFAVNCIEYSNQLIEDHIYPQKESLVSITDCTIKFFNDNHEAWGGVICINNRGEGDPTCYLTIVRTTIDTAIGFKGGALYLANINAKFNSVCVYNATHREDSDEPGTFLYAQGNSDSTEEILEFTQLSVIKCGSNQHNEVIHPDWVKINGTGVNMSSNAAQYQMIYEYREFTLSYSSFSQNQCQNDLILLESTTNIQSCTFYMNSLGCIWLKNSSLIENCYFFENGRHIGTDYSGIIINYCIFDKKAIYGEGAVKEEGNIEVGSSIPPNFNEYMMITQLCPNGPFTEESSDIESIESEGTEQSSEIEIETTILSESEEEPILSSDSQIPISESEEEPILSSDSQLSSSESEEEPISSNDQTQNNPDGEDSGDASPSLSLPIIIAIAVAGVLVIIAVVLPVYCFVCKKKEEPKDALLVDDAKAFQ